MEKSLYYDISEVLSYNRFMNFIIGARGIGKTYNAKKYVINRHMRTGELFVYIRRYKTELKKVGTFFKDVQKEYPDTKFEVKGRSFYIDGKLAGYAIPLSSWQSEKSNAYPEVTTIMFDEFIREKDNSRYLDNEVDAFLNVIDTVVRERDNLRVICLSNSISIVNPYFVYFSLVPDIKKRFNKYPEIMIEIPVVEGFKEQRLQTKFGRLIQGTRYAEMAVENHFIGDSYTFVEKRSKESTHVFNITYKGSTFGVWVDDYLMYASKAYNPYSKNHFVILREDMAEGRTICRGKDNYYLGKFNSAFQKSMLRFDDLQLRNIGYEVLKRL